MGRNSQRVPGPLFPHAQIRAALLAFYDTSARDLPWRRTRDPYAIWVSEVMAQQTRIDTVLPYYERWMARFPDPVALAEAPLDDVLKAWEGLGYYSRARNLHAAAQVVRERYRGSLPSGYDALRALPGVGEYTAGAVSSIAFSQRAPAIDGNVRRVLSRLLDEARPGTARLRQVAAELVPEDRPGDFNQALMELGALICTPRAPRCGECPLGALCGARAAGTQQDRPAPPARRSVPEWDVATLILQAPDGRVLLTRRPDSGLLAGLWAFPARQLEPGEEARVVATELASMLSPGSSPGAAAALGTVAHVFSHRRETYHCIRVGLQDALPEAAVPDAAERAWVGADRRHLTLPRAQQKIHSLVFAGA
jgi:A/G-specific adenine glycosylase